MLSLSCWIHTAIVSVISSSRTSINFFQHFLGQVKEEAPLTCPILGHPRDLSYRPRVPDLQVAKPRRPSLVISDATANAVFSRWASHIEVVEKHGLIIFFNRSKTQKPSKHDQSSHEYRGMVSGVFLHAELAPWSSPGLLKISSGGSYIDYSQNLFYQVYNFVLCAT